MQSESNIASDESLPAPVNRLLKLPEIAQVSKEDESDSSGFLYCLASVFGDCGSVYHPGVLFQMTVSPFRDNSHDDGLLGAMKNAVEWWGKPRTGSKYRVCYVVSQRHFETFYLKYGKLSCLIRNPCPCCSSCPNGCERKTERADCACHFVQFFDFHTLGLPSRCGVLNLPKFGIQKTDPIYGIHWPSTAIVVDSAANAAMLVDERPKYATLMDSEWDAEEEFTIASEDEGLFEDLNAAHPESSGLLEEAEKSRGAQTKLPDSSPTVLDPQSGGQPSFSRPPAKRGCE